jgi:hypothetical protein
VVQATAFHHSIARQPVQGFTPALAVHVGDTHYGYHPDHEIFAKARLDQPYLVSLGLAERLPKWFEAMDSVQEPNHSL